jgi:hypothetical protein
LGTIKIIKVGQVGWGKSDPNDGFAQILSFCNAVAAGV